MSDYQNDPQYRRNKIGGLILGFISLLSFWILVGIASLMPQGHYGPVEALYGMSGPGFLIAMLCLGLSLSMRSTARRIRYPERYKDK